MRKVNEIVSAGIAEKLSLTGGDGFHMHPPADETRNGFMTVEDRILLNRRTSSAVPNTLMQRDSQGQSKVGVPSDSDHIARKGDVDQLKTRVDQIIADGDSSAEVVDARGIYPLLGGRLNAVDAQLADLTAKTKYSGDLSVVLAKMQTGQVVRYCCYGDSITYGFHIGDGAQVANPFPVELQKSLRLLYNNNNIIVANNGHSGWRSNDAINGMQEVLDQSPDVCILMFGINDARGSGEGPAIPIEDYKTNMETLVDTFINAGIEVILCSTTPYILTDNKIIKPYNEALYAIAKARKLHFVDIFKEINTIFEQRFLSTPTLMPDGVHFADQYYKYLAHILLKELWNFPKAEAGMFIPAVNSIYVITDGADIYSNTEQFYGNNYIIRGTGGNLTGTYIRFPVFVDKKSVSLYIGHVKYDLGTKVGITINGSLVATMDSYNTGGFVWDQETLVSSDLEYGLNIVELNRANSTTAGAGGGWDNYLSYFAFK